MSSTNSFKNDDERSAMSFLVNDLVREILSTLKEQPQPHQQQQPLSPLPSSSIQIRTARPPSNTGDVSDSDINARRRHVLDKTSLFFLSRTCFDFVSTVDAHPSCALILSTLMDFSLRALVGAKEGGSLQQGDLLVLQESTRKSTLTSAGRQHYDPAPTKQLRRRAIEVAGDVLASIGPGNAQRCFPGVSSFVAKQLTGVAANNSNAATGPPPMLLRSLAAIRSLLKRAEQHVLMTGPRHCLSRSEAHLRELSRAVEGVSIDSSSANEVTRDATPPSPFPPSWHFIFHPNTTNAPLDLYSDLRTLMALAVGLFGRGLATCLHPSDSNRSRWLAAVLPHLQQHMSLVLSEEVIFLSQHITLDDDRSSELMSAIVRGSRKLKSLIAIATTPPNVGSDNNTTHSLEMDEDEDIRLQIAALGVEMDAAQAALISSYADRTDILTAAVNIAAATFQQEPSSTSTNDSNASSLSHRLGVYGEYGVSISGQVSELLTLLIDCGMSVVADATNASTPTIMGTALSPIGRQMAKGISLIVYEDLNRHMASRHHYHHSTTTTNDTDVTGTTPPFVLGWLTAKLAQAEDHTNDDMDGCATVRHIIDWMEQSWLPNLVGALRGVDGIPSPSAIADAPQFLSLHTSIHWEPSPGRRMPSWLPIVGTYLLPTTLLVLLRQWVPLEIARQEKYARYQAHLRSKGQQQPTSNTNTSYTSVPLTSVPLPFHLALQRQEREELIQAVYGGGNSDVDSAASKVVIDDLVDDVCEGVVENLGRYLTLLTPSQVGSGEGWTERGTAGGGSGSGNVWGHGDDSSGQAEVDDMLRVVRTATNRHHSSSSSPLLDTPILSSEYAPTGTIHTLGTVRLLDGYMLLFNTFSTPTPTTSTTTSSAAKKRAVPTTSTTPACVESLIERCMIPLIEECLYQQPDAYTSHIGALRLHFHAHFLNGRRPLGGSPSSTPAFGAGCFTRPGPGGYSLSTLSHYFANFGASLLPTTISANCKNATPSHPRSPPSSSIVPISLLSLLSPSAASWLLSRPMTVSLIGDNTTPPLFEKLLVPLLSREEFTRVDTTFQRDYIRSVERDLQEATLAAQQLEEDGEGDGLSPNIHNTTSTSASSALVSLLRAKRLFRCILLGREVIGSGTSGEEEVSGGSGEGILRCVAHSLLAEGVAVTASAHFTAKLMATSPSENSYTNAPTPLSPHAYVRQLIGDVLPEVQKAGKRLLVLTMFPVMQMAAPLPFESGGGSELMTAGSENYRGYVQTSAQGLISSLLRPLSVFANQKVPVEIAVKGLMDSLRRTFPSRLSNNTTKYLLTASSTSSNEEDYLQSSALTTAHHQGGASGSGVLTATINSNDAFLQVILANTSYCTDTGGGGASSFVLNQRELIVDECFRMLRTKRADRRAAVYTILGTAVDQLITARQQRCVQLQQQKHKDVHSAGADTGDEISPTKNGDISLHYVPVAVGSHTGILSASLSFTRLFSGCDGGEEDGVDCAADVATNNISPYLSNTSWETASLLTKVIGAVEEGLCDVSALFGSSAPGGEDPQGVWVEPCLRTCSRTLTLAASTVREVYWWRRQIKCELRRIVGTAPATASSPSVRLGTCSCMGIASSTTSSRRTATNADDEDDDAFITEDDSDGEDDYFIGNMEENSSSKKRTPPTPTEEEMEVELDRNGDCSDRPPRSIPSTAPSSGDPNDDTSKTTLRELPVKAWIVQRALYTLTVIARHRDNREDVTTDQDNVSIKQCRQQPSSTSHGKALLDLISAYNSVVRECVTLQLQVLQLSRRLATLLTFLKGRRGGYLQSEGNSTSFVNFLQSSFDSIVTVFTQPKIIKKVKSIEESDENREDSAATTSDQAMILLKSSKRLVVVKQLHVVEGGNDASNAPASKNVQHRQYHIHWHLRVSHWSLLHSLYNAVLMPLVVAVETSSSSSSSSNGAPQRGTTGLSLELMLQEGRRLSSSVVKSRIPDVNALLKGVSARAGASSTTPPSSIQDATTSAQSAVIVSTPRWPVWLSKFPVDSHHKLILQLLERMLRMSPGFLLQRFVEEVAPFLVYIWYRRLLVVGAGRGGGHESVTFGVKEEHAGTSSSSTTTLTPQEKRKMGALILSRSGRSTTSSSSRGEYFLPTQRESLLGKALLKLLRTIHEEAYEAHSKEQRRKRFNDAHMAKQYVEAMQDARSIKKKKTHSPLNVDERTTVVEEVNTSDDDDADDKDDLSAVLKSQGVEGEGEDVDPLFNNPDFDVLPPPTDDDGNTTTPAAGCNDNGGDANSQSRYMKMLDHYYQQVGMGADHIVYVQGLVAGSSSM